MPCIESIRLTANKTPVAPIITLHPTHYQKPFEIKKNVFNHCWKVFREVADINFHIWEVLLRSTLFLPLVYMEKGRPSVTLAQAIKNGNVLQKFVLKDCMGN